MATRTDISTRGKSFDETGMKNGWRLQWAERKIDDENIGQFILKTCIIMCYDPVFFCPFLK